MNEKVMSVLIGAAIIGVCALMLFALAVWPKQPGSLALECRDLVSDGRSTADMWATGAVPEELSGCERPRFAEASSARGVIISCADGRRWLVTVEGIWSPKLGTATEIVGGGL